MLRISSARAAAGCDIRTVQQLLDASGMRRILYRNAIEGIETPPFTASRQLPRVSRTARIPFPVAAGFDQVTAELRTRLSGRWRATPHRATGFRDEVFFVDLYPNRAYRIWKRVAGVPAGEALETGLWEVHLLDLPEGNSPMPFLCFSADASPVTRFGCGLVFVKERYDHSTELRWWPIETDYVIFEATRSPVRRPRP